MTYFIHGCVVSENESSRLINVVYVKPMNAKIICNDFPDFYITLNLQNLLLREPKESFDDTIITTSMTNIDARFIDEDLIRIESNDESRFWIEIVLSMMIYECERILCYKKMKYS